MKYLKITYHELLVFAVLIVAVATRLLLAKEYWPLPNSDEATMGLMAMHIQHGERPIFFYGQNYMGVLEAYIAAPLFSLFGASPFSLRLGLIFLFTAFLITMYLLVRTLYSKNFALCTVILLSLGSNAVLSRELSAIGGYVETLLFAALSFLLATWLALPQAKITKRAQIWRYLGYGAWGLIIGLGIWSDLLILPFALISGLVLFILCWREMSRGGMLLLLLFFMLGSMPFFAYNIHAAPGRDSVSTLLNQEGHESLTLSTLEQQVSNTLELSLPTITGDPFCHYSEYSWLDLLGYQASHNPTPQCNALGTGWSLAYLGLFGLALGMLVITLRKNLFPFRLHEWSIEHRSALIRNSMRLLLGLSGLLALVIFTHSSAPIIWPAIYSRYMIGLWLVTPVVLWPLWRGAANFWITKGSQVKTLQLFTNGISVALLGIVVAVFAFGTAYTLHEIPAALQAKQQEQMLIDDLLKNGITNVYSEYWTCNRLIFETQEHIICAVVDHNLEKGVTRDEQYFTIVNHNPHAAYIFPPGYADAIALAEQRFQREKIAYHLFSLGEYTVIQPLS